jgi:hypothetical protein
LAPETHIELAITSNEQLADLLKNGGQAQADELGIACVINTVDDSRKSRTGDQLTVDGGAASVRMHLR